MKEMYVNGVLVRYTEDTELRPVFMREIRCAQKRKTKAAEELFGQLAELRKKREVSRAERIAR